MVPGGSTIAFAGSESEGSLVKGDDRHLGQGLGRLQVAGHEVGGVGAIEQKDVDLAAQPADERSDLLVAGEALDVRLLAEVHGHPEVAGHLVEQEGRGSQSRRV